MRNHQISAQFLQVIGLKLTNAWKRIFALFSCDSNGFLYLVSLNILNLRVNNVYKYKLSHISISSVFFD